MKIYDDPKENRRRQITPRFARETLKKSGIIVSEEEAEKILELLVLLADNTLKILMETAERDSRLSIDPLGFLFEKSGFSCSICSHSAKNGWYDRNGLRCAICQQAILKHLIPVEICENKDLYYTDFELKNYFDLEGKILTSWIRKGLIKSRTIHSANGYGKHYRVFLLEDNRSFLPPKKILICHKHYTETRDGKELQIPLRWYQIQDDPSIYIKSFGIVNYLNFPKSSNTEGRK